MKLTTRVFLFAWLAFPGLVAAQSPAGATDFNVADRLAIQNVISSHFLELDSCHMDAWIANYADDAVFVAVNAGQRHESDRSAIDKFFRERFRNFKAMGYQRRHVVSNILFVNQSEHTAQVRANGVLLTTNSGADPKVVTTMAYEGSFVKRDGVWKIQKWVVRTDTSQNYDKSNLPEGVRTSADVED